MLRGYLTGSIDAVLRVGGRYLVVDYKTNRLGAPDEPLTAWDYRADAMAEAMLHAHYPLQALLYEVALHRYLRWRLPGYDPDAAPRRRAVPVPARHVRAGRRRSRRHVPGVFAWQPPAALVVALSDLLAAEVRRMTGSLRRGRRAARGLQRRRRAHAGRRARRAAARRAGRETDERVLLAVALTVRGTRHGSVVLDLADAADTITRTPTRTTGAGPVELPWPEPADWVAACAASPLVTGAAGGPPLQMVGSAAVARPVLAAGGAGRRRPADAQRRPAGRPRPRRAAAPTSTSCSTPAGPTSGAAVAVAALSRVERDRRRAGHRQDHDGRAADRRAAAGSSGPSCGSRWPRRPARRRPGWRRRCTPRPAGSPRPTGPRSPGCPRRPCTGCSAGGPASSSRFRHDRDNHLPYDVVIVDESSMVSLTLMARLLEALAPAHPAGAGRRPRPAGLGRGGRRARRPRRQDDVGR